MKVAHSTAKQEEAEHFKKQKVNLRTKTIESYRRQTSIHDKHENKNYFANHSPPRGSTVKIHRVSVNDRNVAVARGRNGPFGGQGTPSAGDKIEHVRVLQVAIAVVSTVQNHRVFVHHTCATVPGARHISTVLHLRKKKRKEKKIVFQSTPKPQRRSKVRSKYLGPAPGVEVELVKVTSVGTIVSTKHKHGLLVHNGGMRVSWRWSNSAQHFHR